VRFTAASTPTARRGTGLVRVAGRGAARPADSSVDIGFWAALPGGAAWLLDGIRRRLAGGA